MTDKEGLDRAYQSDDNYFIHGNTMYIAGTKNLRDVYDDVYRIPFYGNSRKIERYEQAKKALIDHPEVVNLRGHSLGGSVALELSKNFSHIETTRTYGSPIWDPLGKDGKNVERYKNYMDPVSYFDNSAKTSFKPDPFSSSSLTHGYSNLAQNFTSTSTQPAETTNPDGTISIIG